MNKVLSLSKAILKSSSNIFFVSKKGKRQNKKSRAIAAFIGLGFIYAYVAGLTGFMSYSISAPLNATNEGILLSPILTLLLVSICLFFGLFTMLSMFFTASDNHLWLPLPLKIREIFTARFITNIFFLLIIEMMFIVPAFVGFNIAIGPGILSYFGQLVLIIAIPILVISLSFILILGLSRLINIQKYRKTFQVISAVMIFVFAFGISFISSSGGQIIGDSVEDIDLIVQALRLLSSELGWMRFLTFFTDGVFANLGYQSIVFPLILLTIAVATFFIAYFLSDKFYHASLYSSDISKKRGKTNKGKNKIKVSSPLIAFFKNEVRTVFRSPTYFFNLVAPIIIVLIIMAGSVAITLTESEGPEVDINTIVSTLFVGSNGSLFIIVTGVLSFFLMMNMVSATSITREGNNAQLLKIYPIATRKIIYGKMLLGLLINFVVYTPVIITLAIIGGGNFLLVLAYIIMVTLVNIAMNYSSILLDSRFPMLNWSNEIEAAKNNKNILISMGVNLLINGLVFLPLIPVELLKLPIWLAFIISASLFSVIILLFELIVKKQRGQLFKKIQ